MPENRKQRQAIAGAVLAALLLGFILFLWLGIRWYTSQDNGTFVVPQTTASQSPAQAANKTAALRQTAALLNQMASALSTAGPLPTSRPANTLDLLVVDADTQKPIPGIAIISGFAKERFRGTTAVNGHVYVPMPTGRVNNFNIAVRGKKYVPVRRQWYGGNMNGENFPTSLTMELQRGVAIGGRVVDEYGQPVDGAEIHISVWADSPGDEIYDGNSASGYRTVRTNADGRWRFTNVPPQCQSIQIGIQAPGYVGDLARLRDFTPMSQLYARTAVITLARGLDCYATVLGPDGKPVTGADVAIGDDQDMWDPAGPGLTDQSGRFHTKFA
ncbi:MAG TPA: carboxypeptidase-like regulatory domain-containing protein, partial [Tepidisphaeraceae bacterium]|nr:carboxypeptidase-like regulatory domain-containing protein [Tepidisphaeraceae bacterium]